MVKRTALNPWIPPSNALQPPKSPFTRWPRTTDAILAILVFLITVVVSLEDPNQDFTASTVSDIPMTAYILFAMASSALIWRRHQPLVVVGVVLFASALSMALNYFNGPLVALVVSLYSVGRYASNSLWSFPGVPWSYLGVGAAIALTSIGELIETGLTADIAVVLTAVFLTWYIGRRIHIRGQNLRERKKQLKREQATEARRAVAEERTRIARELHDVVAHKVSLMTVQAGAAKTIAADDPAGALQAMEAVENAGRQALHELRHLMGVLRPEVRPEADDEGLTPQPGLADAPQLVEHLKEAGLQVSLTMDAVQTHLPASVNLSAYRIVQEALTNVLKHAGPARTEVRVCIDNHGITIEVLDDGQGSTVLPDANVSDSILPDSSLPGSGHGIAGMRERAQLLGGSLDAGPRPGGGFQVIAHLPVEFPTEEESL